MKCLSLKPPWHWAILEGHKQIENRTWRTNYRGPLLIHASKTWDEQGARILNRNGFHGPFPANFGMIVGIVDLIDVIDDLMPVASKWFTGPFGWILRNPRWLPKPILWRGMLGLFDVPDEVIQEKTK